MAIIGGTQFLERIRFFNGERLFADDLQAIESFNREMRWLHNQSLHQPGVGSGFTVVGDPGDRQVTISAGYAIDAEGREIILTETTTLAVPPVADDDAGGSVFYALTVSYPSEADLKPTETREGICAPIGVVRLREAPVFCWVRLSDDPIRRQPVDPRLKQLIERALFIVLAQIEVFNCQLKKLNTAVRPNARPAKRPRIGCGTDKTPAWRPKPKALAAGVTSVAAGDVMYEATIDTTGAGFQATPHYVARIAGRRLDVTTGVFADALIDVTLPSPTDFIIRMFPIALGDPLPLIQEWSVEWMGIED
jgi:hypothetical protein